ncbi:LysR family transcriptional regulator [Streptomyces iconiensis]|uniref:LysR family transcriptional regulator n=1 Tax=Streptomyces iconiensis TaxID=1384038 RepID=A0ABT7A507_9ACTN|nr:LysR family transcriptional regulator [Streptomyces iconiensis]MDJ1136137.1 LysR family transcriptional regulator [Streptomyces iconiensis]
MPSEPAPRLLRAFVAVAEELHFTRAASRLYVAQQALSRDVRSLEREVGAVLFVRSTRAVALTPEGERLLPYARRVLAAYDELSRAFGGAGDRPLAVDAAAPGSTGQRVLDAAREAAPSVEFVARYYSGLAGAAADILAGRLDLSFGRAAGLPRTLLSGLGHRLVRYEPVAVLLPAEHPLAAHERVPLAELAGETLYAGAGNPDTTEWTAYARSLFAGRGVQLAEPFPKIEGEREFARVVRGRRWCVLATSVFIGVEGMVLRPLTDPVPLAPVSVVWRRGLRHTGLDAVLDTALRLGEADGWLTRPRDSWLPPEDTALLG